MKKAIWTIIFILFVAASLCACSSEAFPTGTYYTYDEVHTIEYRDDGTFTYISSDEVVTEGTYSIQDDEITWITDSACDGGDAGPATYQWQHDDGKLSFKLIGEDLCEGRRDTLSVIWFGPN